MKINYLNKKKYNNKYINTKNSSPYTIPFEINVSLNHHYPSILWILSSTASFMVAVSLSKVIDVEISIFVLLFMRSTFGLLFIIPFLLHEKIENLKTSKPSLHILRVIFIYASMYCTYYAYRHLPLAIASSLGFVEPLILTFLSWMILKDKTSLLKWGGLIFGYLGVLLIVRPGVTHANSAMGVALLANLFVSLSIICAKKLSSSESTCVLMFYANATSFVISSILAAWVWKTPILKDIFFLLLIGFFGVIYQFCYLQALRSASPSFLAPFQYTRLIIAILIGVIFFKEIPHIWSLLGASFIILSTYIVIL
jgi:drug/metabolite transporter (DMT)-like permease